MVFQKLGFFLKTLKKAMKKTIGSDYLFLSRERKFQRGKRGAGGVGLVIKKNIGNVSIVKSYDDFEVLWAKLDTGREIYFIGIVYIPPNNVDTDFKVIVQNLEADCITFSNSGNVILLGDFNARIGNLASIVQCDDNLYKFTRSMLDANPSNAAYTRGHQLIHSMNAANMIIVNGIESIGNFTCEIKQGKSTDYIMLSSNLLFSDASADSKSFSGLISDDSIYLKKSFKVWNEDCHLIDDHFLLTCKLKLKSKLDSSPMLTSSSSGQNLGHPLEIMKWNRRDRGDPNFWIPMQNELEKSLFSWDFSYSANQSLSTDKFVDIFNQHVNSALVNSLPMKKRANTRTFLWDSMLSKLHCSEKQSYLAFKHAADVDKAHLRKLWKTAKRNLRKFVSKLERKEERRNERMATGRQH